MELISQKTARFSESVIREMTRLAGRHRAINLAQGFPNFPAPEFVKEAAVSAIRKDYNQYAITWGASSLRRAVSDSYASRYSWTVDPEREITVTCGATEAMIASILAVINPGEKVLIFQPFYENYGPDTVIAGAEPVYVPLDPDDNWSFDPVRLEQTIAESQADGGIKALILNTPNNPTGKVFSGEELARIAELANRYNFLVVTDEIYEFILYDGCRHLPIALQKGMRERTITISGLSKTFAVTGWRLGYILAPPPLSDAIRKMHDFLTVGAPAPLQEAAAQAMQQAGPYYARMAEQYLQRRDFLLGALNEIGFKTWKPSGAYYILTDISPLTRKSDVEFVTELITRHGVAAVPGSSFFDPPEQGRRYVRFAFCKTLELLEEAVTRLQRLRD